MEIKDFVRDMAIQEICQFSGNPTTEYEISTVDLLTKFGTEVLSRWIAIHKDVIKKDN